MRRREFITLLGGAAAWPLAARAQQPALPVVGFLHPASPHTLWDRLPAFRQGLKETGFVEGETVAVQYGWADNQIDRLPMLAAELVRRRVERSLGESSPCFRRERASTLFDGVPPAIRSQDRSRLGRRASNPRLSRTLLIFLI